MTNFYKSWVVDAASSGLRLDVFLQKMGGERSRSEWSRLIEDGCVFVNTKKVTQRSHRLAALDEVTFDHQQKEQTITSIPTNVSFVPPEVLFEDESLMIINKPEGLPVHSGNGVPFEKTLACWVLNKKYLSKD